MTAVPPTPRDDGRPDGADRGVQSGGEACEMLDVLIVGGGLSGISAAHALITQCPRSRWAIFESRDTIGGTWDLFRYPGIRSDSDMTTLGFPFRPWRGDKAIADGADILDYIRDTAREYDIDRKVRFGHRVIAAEWSGDRARWQVTYETDAGAGRIECRFLFLCAGYYDYEEAHRPQFEDEDRFAGEIVHPQFWPENMEVEGRRFVVIGSGATAVTMVPALAQRGARRVTMLQRSPGYIVSLPSRDRVGAMLRRVFPQKLADFLIRWKNIGLSTFFYNFARKRPDAMRRRVKAMQRDALRPDFDIERHFTPDYDPWDQRLCLVPDGDLFEALNAGTADIVTDEIARFDADGIVLTSGGHVPADVIVTATGLKLKVMGGMTIAVDGEEVTPGSRLVYKGAMLDRVPNFAFAVGYTNASWTLKCDLTARLVARLLNHMDSTGADFVQPVAGPDDASDEPMLDLQSGYLQRSAGILPRQGRRPPWRVEQNYFRDLRAFRKGKPRDGVLQYGKAGDQA
ncbi:NAD(P)/FAD-dependent oxidoreductase [uncultured Croceicoccus sp.]|uniref:flavin-containing monooxygenase n=1 Tax=uncultured Croceicoccus sp. TaxID=1295329 RepID=UPI00260CC240|nr:NAD(P)/FAD-dependent oxidoreductase [uncultured Croceicoccus sp.]